MKNIPYICGVFNWIIEFMELKVYINQSAWRNGKTILCRRISVPDSFDLHATITVLRNLFGADCVIELLVV